MNNNRGSVFPRLLETFTHITCVLAFARLSFETGIKDLVPKPLPSFQDYQKTKWESETCNYGLPGQIKAKTGFTHNIQHVS